MVDFNTAIELIRRNGGFKPNKRDDSYYRTYKTQGNRPQQARISNHGTHLWTWYDRDYDPSYAINTCIVFSESGTHDSDVSVDMNIKDKQVNVIGQRKTMEVIQYVYNCQLLDENDTSLINKEVQSIWQNNGFKDPLAGTPKHAKVFKLIPNQPIQTITENKQYNKNKNMKQTIRLTESELRNMITESVRKIIKEAIVPKACAYCGNPIKQGDNYCSKCGANIQEMVNKYNAWLQQNPNVNNEPMVWGQQSQQQPMQQSQQPMQQQQQPPQQRQQPTSTNNNTMINNQVQSLLSSIAKTMKMPCDSVSLLEVMLIRWGRLRLP